MRYLELYANIWAHISIKVTRVHIKSRNMHHGIAIVKSIHRQTEYYHQCLDIREHNYTYVACFMLQKFLFGDYFEHVPHQKQAPNPQV